MDNDDDPDLSDWHYWLNQLLVAVIFICGLAYISFHS